MPYVTDELFPILRQLADRSVLVDDQATLAAIRVLLLRHKLMVEPAGAIALAAAQAVPAAERGVSVCILSGGSLDHALLRRIVAE